MTFADMTRNDWVGYFNFHGDLLLRERALFVSAAERWASVCKRCNAYENPTMTAAEHTAGMLEAADGPIAEEIADYIGP